MAVLCLAAVATKQSFVAAGVAAAAFLWLRDRRTGLRFAGALVGLGLLALALALGHWGPGFWYSTVTALRNPQSWAKFAQEWRYAAGQPLFVFLEQPRVLNLLLPRVTYDFGPQAYLNDCVHYRLLWQDGTLDHRPLVSALERHAFDCVILPPHLYSTERQANPRLGAIVDAVQQHYVNHGEKAHIQFFVRPKQTQELEHAQAK